MALGVGVALARAGRERIEERARARERELALLPSEALGAGLRRMALGQVDLALALLQGRDGNLEEDAVHEVRKALKRLRALIRMLREELGPRAFARENHALGEIAGRLSGARDSEVMLATLEGLLARHPGKLSRRRDVIGLHAALVAEHELAERLALGDLKMRSEVLTELLAFRRRVEGWPLREAEGIALVEPGLQDIYRQGRRRYRRLARAKQPRTPALHQWRKRVKDLRYAAEMLQRGTHPGLAATLVGGGKSRSAKRIKARQAELRRVARQADELGELLGEDHDLAVLAELIGAAGRSGAGGRAAGRRLSKRTRKLLLGLIDRRRRRLQDRALRTGARLYRRRPGRFLTRVRAAYASVARD